MLMVQGRAMVVGTLQGQHAEESGKGEEGR